MGQRIFSVLRAQSRQTTRPDVSGFLTLLARYYPCPQCTLQFHNEWECLIAIALSARATDAKVNGVTQKLWKVAPNAEAMLRLGQERIASHIRSLGLVSQKAQAVWEISDYFHRYGVFPSTLDALTQLRGVGEKTARVFLNLYRHDPYIAVDTHVFRVTYRLGLVQSKNVRTVEKELEAQIPIAERKLFSLRLIAHGREYCLAQKPRCQSCPLKTECLFARCQSVCNASG